MKPECTVTGNLARNVCKYEWPYARWQASCSSSVCSGVCVKDPHCTSDVPTL